uniref:Uncharacterized protein n=1 Tax=Sphaerodactylus townsendi TaxID=933632 RepID=A0ACB8EBN9_9SAUR
MSYPQFGYPYSSAPQFLMTTNSLTTCCETSGRTLTDSAAAAASAQAPVYCPVYESRLLANSAAARRRLREPLPRQPGLRQLRRLRERGLRFLLPESLVDLKWAWGGAGWIIKLRAPTTFQLPHLGIKNSFESKEGSGSAHAGLAQAAAYYPYEPTLSQYQYDRYGALDGGTRRKNATRETTSTLKAWLQELQAPYPTKGEKIMLAIITKMTLTQVSTWFANARRRLKKENKMTWPPRNKGADEKGPFCRKDDDDEEAAAGADALKSRKLPEAPSKEDKDLALSDLEDYDPLESESSEGELKAPAFGHVETDVCLDEACKESARDGALERAKAAGPEGCGAAELLGGRASRAGCEAKQCFHHQQQQQVLEAGKPRIWSLARASHPPAAGRVPVVHAEAPAAGGAERRPRPGLARGQPARATHQGVPGGQPQELGGRRLPRPALPAQHFGPLRGLLGRPQGGRRLRLLPSLGDRRGRRPAQGRPNGPRQRPPGLPQSRQQDVLLLAAGPRPTPPGASGGGGERPAEDCGEAGWGTGPPEELEIAFQWRGLLLRSRHRPGFSKRCGGTMQRPAGLSEGGCRLAPTLKRPATLLTPRAPPASPAPAGLSEAPGWSPASSSGEGKGLVGLLGFFFFSQCGMPILVTKKQRGGLPRTFPPSPLHS